MPEIKEKAGIGAMTSRGKTGHQVTAGWLLHLAPLGGKIFDDEWNPVINSPEAVKAAEIMRTINQTGPTGIPAYGFSEASAAFLQGDAAMYLDTLKIAAMSRNEKLSKVDGNVGFALHPTGSRCGFSTFAGDGLVDPEICFAKFEAMAEGAEIASATLWGH